MKKQFSFLVLIFLTISVGFAQITPPSLPEVLNQINKDSLKRTVHDMQSFGSRLCTKTVGQNRKVAQYLVDRLKTYGVENAQIDSFYVSTWNWLTGSIDQYMYNVLGTLKGTGETDSTVIIGAHLDAISYTGNYQLTASAPGADDNATGCAVMIEMARIIYENDLKPRHNIDFMAYDAEEIGLFGAYYDAEKRAMEDEKIIVMLNNDMVGFQPETEPWKVILHWYYNAQDVTEKAYQAAIDYTTVTPYIPNSQNNGMNSASDSWAYYEWGFKATFAIEYEFSPYYHSVNDLIEKLNFEYCRQIARMNFVLLADYADMNLIRNSIACHNNYKIHIDVFPNPATDIIRVHNYNDLTITQIDIYDIAGRLRESVNNITQPQTLISLSSLSSGVYFMRIYSDKGVVNKKIIKQ